MEAYFCQCFDLCRGLLLQHVGGFLSPGGKLLVFSFKAAVLVSCLDDYGKESADKKRSVERYNVEADFYFNAYAAGNCAVYYVTAISLLSYAARSNFVQYCIAYYRDRFFGRHFANDSGLGRQREVGRTESSL